MISCYLLDKRLNAGVGNDLAIGTIFWGYEKRRSSDKVSTIKIVGAKFEWTGFRTHREQRKHISIYWVPLGDAGSTRPG